MSDQGVAITNKAAATTDALADLGNLRYGLLAPHKFINIQRNTVNSILVEATDVTLSDGTNIMQASVGPVTYTFSAPASAVDANVVVELVSDGTTTKVVAGETFAERDAEAGAGFDFNGSISQVRVLANGDLAWPFVQKGTKLQITPQIVLNYATLGANTAVSLANHASVSIVRALLRCDMRNTGGALVQAFVTPTLTGIGTMQLLHQPTGLATNRIVMPVEIPIIDGARFYARTGPTTELQIELVGYSFI